MPGSQVCTTLPHGTLSLGFEKCRFDSGGEEGRLERGGESEESGLPPRLQQSPLLLPLLSVLASFQITV